VIQHNIISIVVRLLSILLLIGALDRHPYGYYQFLRVVTCGVAAYLAFIANLSKKEVWTWILGIIAVIFNPFLPIHLSREIWQVFDLVTAVIFFVSMFFIKHVESAE